MCRFVACGVLLRTSQPSQGIRSENNGYIAIVCLGLRNGRESSNEDSTKKGLQEGQKRLMSLCLSVVSLLHQRRSLNYLNHESPPNRVGYSVPSGGELKPGDAPGTQNFLGNTIISDKPCLLSGPMVFGCPLPSAHRVAVCKLSRHGVADVQHKPGTPRPSGHGSGVSMRARLLGKASQLLILSPILTPTIVCLGLSQSS